MTLRVRFDDGDLPGLTNEELIAVARNPQGRSKAEKAETLRAAEAEARRRMAEAVRSDDRDAWLLQAALILDVMRETYRNNWPSWRGRR